MISLCNGWEFSETWSEDFMRFQGDGPFGPPAPHGEGVFPALCRAPGLRDGLRLPAEAGHPR